MDPDGLKPWLPISGETGKAYHSFVHFLTLPPWERSLARAYTSHLINCKKAPNDGKLAHAPACWTEWRFKYSWLERVAAHDAEAADHERQMKLVALEAMNQRHIESACDLQDMVGHRLKLMIEHPTKVEMSPSEMAKVLREATAIERRARDVATSITKTEGDASGNALALDLTKLDTTELAVFEALVQKCQTSSLTSK
jgi:hypothetical protein